MREHCPLWSPPVSSMLQMGKKSMEQIDDCVLHADAWMICKMQGVQLASHQVIELVQYNPLQVVGLPGIHSLGDWNHT